MKKLYPLIIFSSLIFSQKLINKANTTFDLTHIPTRNLHFDMVKPGGKGTVLVKSFWKDKQLHIIEDLNIPGFQEGLEMIVDDQLNPVSVVIDGMGGAIHADVKFNDKTVSGSYKKYQNPKAIEFDLPILKTDLVRPAILFTLQALPLKEEFSYTYRQFAPMGAEFRNVTYKVTGSEQVEVPAGTFDCFKITGHGGATDQVFYVTKSAPRKIVKITFASTTWEYHLNHED